MSNERPTTEAEFQNALVELGVERCSVIYVTANIGSLGFPAYNSKKLITDKHEIAKFYLNCIEAVIGSQGTIVFPTHSWGMLTNPEPFDPVVTGCDYLFSEFILKNRPIKRQLHPLASLAATGPLADQLIPSRITSACIWSWLGNGKGDRCQRNFFKSRVKIREHFHTCSSLRVSCSRPLSVHKELQKERHNKRLHNKRAIFHSCSVSIG